MRGTFNEPAVIRALYKKDFVVEVHKYEVLRLKDLLWFAISPDGVTYIDDHSLGPSDEQTPQLSSTEIKPSVAMSSLEQRQKHASADVHTRTVDDAQFCAAHSGRTLRSLLHQSFALQVEYLLCVAAFETALVYGALLGVLQSVSEHCLHVLQSFLDGVISWAHGPDAMIQTFADSHYGLMFILIYKMFLQNASIACCVGAA